MRHCTQGWCTVDCFISYTKCSVLSSLNYYLTNLSSASLTHWIQVCPAQQQSLSLFLEVWCTGYGQVDTLILRLFSSFSFHLQSAISHCTTHPATALSVLYEVTVLKHNECFLQKYKVLFLIVVMCLNCNESLPNLILRQLERLL